MNTSTESPAPAVVVSTCVGCLEKDIQIANLRFLLEQENKAGLQTYAEIAQLKRKLAEVLGDTGEP